MISVKPAEVPTTFAGPTPAAAVSERRRRQLEQSARCGQAIADAEARALATGITDPEFPEDPCPFAVAAVCSGRAFKTVGAIRAEANRRRRLAGAVLLKAMGGKA